jgi:hypothetical protein
MNIFRATAFANDAIEPHESPLRGFCVFKQRPVALLPKPVHIALITPLLGGEHDPVPGLCRAARGTGKGVACLAQSPSARMIVEGNIRSTSPAVGAHGLLPQSTVRQSFCFS